MSDKDDQERPSKDLVFKTGKTTFTMGTADFLALGALVVTVIIAVGMVMGRVDGKIGSGLIVALCGGAAIAKVVSARGRSPKG